ncbi:hypothetical protein MSG28_008665 [Choristoneura fumiferana]|uniref:Uncharacterized protein n=1 Tax=Choristoneura fumiferana TaxID=7141 RepID=A0ACC0J7L6_CHOFU|nr:hypothetical protein MSG28_008665 [Choristoneura fumiferana]
MRHPGNIASTPAQPAPDARDRCHAAPRLALEDTMLYLLSCRHIEGYEGYASGTRYAVCPRLATLAPVAPRFTITETWAIGGNRRLLSGNIEADTCAVSMMFSRLLQEAGQTAARRRRIANARAPPAAASKMTERLSDRPCASAPLAFAVSRNRNGDQLKYHLLGSQPA